MERAILAFVKIGKLEHMESLIKKGIIFMNTINTFKDMDNAYRGDKNEGASVILQAENTRIEIEMMGKTIIIDKDHGLHNQIILHENKYGNIYSLYMIYPDEDFTVDERIYAFGEYSVLIIEPNTFIERVLQKIKELDFPAVAREVEYVNKKKYEGDLSVFNKFEDYQYQNEYRIYIQNVEEKPRVLEIGSLEDIAVLIPTEYFRNLKIRKEFV